MLDFKRSRIDYGEQLSPPEGFEMESAVATTYSLDMLALLSIPVALFYSKNLDGKVNENRMDILDAIQKTSDKVKIYCQKSKIIRPDNNMLISFVEDCVTEILPQKANNSFHPKIWVIRYRGKDKSILYRVIVLSRNMTYDRCWDVAYFLEGYLGSKQNKNNQPLADYLKYLSKISDFKNSNLFIKDLLKVNFKTEKPFDKFSFHPIGFEEYKNPLWNEKFEDLIIISPFLDITTLKFFSNGNSVNRKKYLFSRKEELDKIHLNILNKYDVYAFSQRVVDGEDDIELSEESEDETKSQNLHAKIFIGSKKDKKTRWFLGSANCTYAAMKRNYEFLISLDSKDKYASIREMLKIFLPKTEKGGIQIFEKYDRETREPVKSDEFDFRKIIHSLLSYLENKENFKAVCKPESRQSDKYRINITLSYNKIFSLKEFKITCAPYGWGRDLKPIKSEMSLSFDGFALHNLSPFFIWNIQFKPTGESKEFITRMPIKLPEGRKQSIFRSIIKDKDKFFQFIQFLLGSNDDEFEFPGKKEKTNHSGGESFEIFKHKQPLFEDLLKASSRDPDKLKDIDKVIKQLQNSGTDDIIPEDFKTFWKVFQEAIKVG